ncbi:MAG TPA: acyl-CoA synthetase [Alphaproteobacteria bacterium]|nr:acyl-CoA synthetase [Alphaproteobacteria bacterium]
MSAPEGPFPRFNIARYCLAENARLRAQKPALIVAKEPERELVFRFGEFEDSTLRLARRLRELGLAHGSRVIIRLEASEEFALAFMAVIAAGFIAVPSSTMLTAPELAFVAADSEAALILCDEPPPGLALAAGCRLVGADLLSRPEASPRGDYADTAWHDPAFLIYTSGTTSRPKGVLHAQRNAWGRWPMRRGWTGLKEADLMLHAGRLNWTYTLGVGLMDPWSVGATAVLYDGPQDNCAFPALIERHRCTIFTAVSGLYRQILKHCRIESFDLSSLRHGLAAGEPLSPGVLEEWRHRVGTELYESLGMTEISTYVSCGPETPVVPGSAGKPQPGRRVAILPIQGGPEPLPTGETGLLAVHRSDPALMLGYWRRPEEEARCYRGEWFVGGDLAAQDERGYIWFRGRNDDLMKPLGYRVSPVEVEAVLQEHPGIAEAAVAEHQVAEGVRIVAAFVVPRGGTPLEASEVLAWCESRLARYKRPREVFFAEALPRTANGKLMRRALRPPDAG